MRRDDLWGVVEGVAARLMARRARARLANDNARVAGTSEAAPYTTLHLLPRRGETSSWMERGIPMTPTPWSLTGAPLHG